MSSQHHSDFKSSTIKLESSDQLSLTSNASSSVALPSQLFSSLSSDSSTVTSFCFNENSSTDSLWNTPKSGTFKNPYFSSSSEVNLETNNCSSSLIQNAPSQKSSFFTDFQTEERSNNLYDDSNETQGSTTTYESEEENVTISSEIQNLISQKIKLDDSKFLSSDKNEEAESLLSENVIMQIDTTDSQNNSEFKNDNNQSLTKTVKIASNKDLNKNKTNSANNLTNGSKEYQSQKLTCVRLGCSNEAISSPEWDLEFCSNKCAVSYCKSAFLNWTSSKQLE